MAAAWEKHERAGGRQPSTSVSLFPRRKKCMENSPGLARSLSRSKSNPDSHRSGTTVPLTICRQEVTKRFHMKQNEAAMELGISLTALKKVCRKMGVPRWPYTKHSTHKRAASAPLPYGKRSALAGPSASSPALANATWEQHASTNKGQLIPCLARAPLRPCSASKVVRAGPHDIVDCVDALTISDLRFSVAEEQTVEDELAQGLFMDPDDGNATCAPLQRDLDDVSHDTTTLNEDMTDAEGIMMPGMSLAMLPERARALLAEINHDLQREAACGRDSNPFHPHVRRPGECDMSWLLPHMSSDAQKHDMPHAQWSPADADGIVMHDWLGWWLQLNQESRLSTRFSVDDPDSSQYTDNTVERRGPAGMLSAYTITP